MEELPDRPVVHLQPTFGKLGDKPAQGEVSVLGALQQPEPVLPSNRLRLVAPIWPGETLPVSRRRLTQLIAVLMPTPNWAAA